MTVITNTTVTYLSIIVYSGRIVINNIIIITRMIFMVLSSWQSHCESSPGSFDECRLSAKVAANPRPSQLTWTVSPPKGSYRPHPPSPFYFVKKLINICMAYGLQWDICFHSVKSQIACFGGKSPDCECINIRGKIINWSDHVKYLGCGKTKIEVDPSRCVGKFYGAFNTIVKVY